MEVLKLLSVLWRRAWVIVLSIILFVAVAIVATLLLPTQYTAETQVMVTSDTSTTSLLNSIGLQSMASELTMADSEIQDKMYVATSPPLIGEVVWQLQLRNKNGDLYDPKDVSAAGLLAPVLGVPTVTLTQTSGTDVLLIDATANSPEAARLMADTVAETYIKATTDQSRAQTKQAQDFIKLQLAEVTRQIDEAYTNIAAAQRESEVIDLTDEVHAAIGRLSSLLSTQDELLAKMDETRAKIRAAREYRGQESVDNVSPDTLRENPVVAKLRGQLSDLQSKRDALLTQNYTQKAPEIVAVNASIESTSEALKRALAEQADLDPTIAQLEADLAGQAQREAATRDAIDQTLQKYTSYPEQMKKFSQLNLIAKAAESIFHDLEAEQYQIGIAEAMTLSDIRVTARAELPDDKSSPKPLLNLAAGILLGLCFGCGSALALEYIDDTIRTTEDVKKTWDISHLGLLPRFKSDGPALATAGSTDPVFEAHRALRNSIDFASVDKPIQLLGVTSTIPGEGKSTVAMNLAISMAQEGRRVLVVDADLRLPTQHKHFPSLLAAPGLVEVLARTVRPEDAVQATPIENLHVLVAGDLPPNPGHLIESLRMRQVLLELSRNYDVVIVDTPPILAVNDSVVLARFLHGILLVVEAHRATGRLLRESRLRFEAAHVQPIGFVLNKVRSGSYPYGYFKYTKYYQKTAKKRSATAAKTGGAA